MGKKAKESSKIRKARRKLEKQLAKEDELMTPEKLANMTKNIQNWIQRHASERCDLKEKNIELFDENRHAARISSRHIRMLRSKIKQELEQEKQINLKGRIKLTNHS